MFEEQGITTKALIAIKKRDIPQSMRNTHK